MMKKRRHCNIHIFTYTRISINVVCINQIVLEFSINIRRDGIAHKMGKSLLAMKKSLARYKYISLAKTKYTKVNSVLFTAAKSSRNVIRSK